MIKNDVEKRRLLTGRSKAHLARQIHVDRSYITRLEQGKLQPSAEIMFRLAAYFECKVEDVFWRVPDKGTAGKR